MASTRQQAACEDSPFTNAGMGSNLNLLGEIECDASIMDGKSLNFGAVGALSGFSLAAFKRNKRKLELAERVETDFIQLKKRRQSSAKENDSGTLDTVGAVVVDHEGNVAAAVSSGGLALKHPGRVGQAALYGCGCWAENTGAHNPYSTAVSTSGCGEHLVRTILARECSHALQAEDAHQALLETMQNKFISSPFLASEDGVLGGVIVLRSCRCSSESDSSPNKQTLLEMDKCKALKHEARVIGLDGLAPMVKAMKTPAKTMALQAYNKNSSLLRRDADGTNLRAL
ncbi:Threonine aspartase 1 [Microtus ochrogaster]|uniref:Threonine aspartase 1 n=1 Tax=Microtus ochrogaster TaxID=79684 RepID=A0A8J6GJ75_MICOH|nr:Threonine aspartase 1 [Microtus ochrogaster]